MSMRLSEVHPSLVHFPIALLPVAIAADAAGLARRDRELLAVGKWAIIGAAASAAVAGVFGFIAQEEASVEGEAVAVLHTHRTMNIALLGVVSTLAISRAARKRPSVGYLAAGLGAVAALVYSAYLGGKLVYSHGLAVEKAGGVYGEDPTLTPANAGRAAKAAVTDLGKGVFHTARDMAKGSIAPVLSPRAR